MFRPYTSDKLASAQPIQRYGYSSSHHSVGNRSNIGQRQKFSQPQSERRDYAVEFIYDFVSCWMRTWGYKRIEHTRCANGGVKRIERTSRVLHDNPLHLAHTCRCDTHGLTFIHTVVPGAHRNKKTAMMTILLL